MTEFSGSGGVSITFDPDQGVAQFTLPALMPYYPLQGWGPMRSPVYWRAMASARAQSVPAQRQLKVRDHPELKRVRQRLAVLEHGTVDAPVTRLEMAAMVQEASFFPGLAAFVVSLVSSAARRRCQVDHLLKRGLTEAHVPDAVWGETMPLDDLRDPRIAKECLVHLLRLLAESYKLEISAVKTGHRVERSDDPRTDGGHGQGEAADITGINGVTLRSNEDLDETALRRQKQLVVPFVLDAIRTGFVANVGLGPHLFDDPEIVSVAKGMKPPVVVRHDGNGNHVHLRAR